MIELSKIVYLHFRKNIGVELSNNVYLYFRKDIGVELSNNVYLYFRKDMVVELSKIGYESPFPIRVWFWYEHGRARKYWCNTQLLRSLQHTQFQKFIHFFS